MLLNGLLSINEVFYSESYFINFLIIRKGKYKVVVYKQYRRSSLNAICGAFGVDVALTTFTVFSKRFMPVMSHSRPPALFCPTP